MGTLHNHERKQELIFTDTCTAHLLFGGQVSLQLGFVVSFLVGVSATSLRELLVAHAARVRLLTCVG